MRIWSLVRRLAYVPALSLALLFAAGCGSKVAECNKLIEVMNKENTKIAALKPDPSGFGKMADELEASANAIGAVDVKTAELVKFRDDVKKLYTDVAGAVRAASSGDPTKMAAALKPLAEMGTNTQKLVTDINAFCGGTK
jgi:hypothetical protein